MVIPSASKNRRHVFIIKGYNPDQRGSSQSNFKLVSMAGHHGCSRLEAIELYQEIIGGMLRALLNLSRIALAVVYH